MEKIIVIPDGYKFYSIENGEIHLKKDVPILPETINECLSEKLGLKNLSLSYYSGDRDSVWISNSEIRDKLIETHLYIPSEYIQPVIAICNLITCRNKWWDILKYTPNWENRHELKYCIHVDHKFVAITTHSNFPRILAFPTYEIADKFRKAFSGLISEAKSLL